MLMFGIALIRHAYGRSPDVLRRSWRLTVRSGATLAVVLLVWTLWRLRH